MSGFTMESTLAVIPPVIVLHTAMAYLAYTTGGGRWLSQKKYSFHAVVSLFCMGESTTMSTPAANSNAGSNA
jgi:hypothetical protein